MALNAHIAPLAAIERIITVMQANYATELADASIAVTGLPLPAPASTEYYPTLESDEATVREQTGPVAVYVWQARPLPTGANESTLQSGSPSQSAEIVEIYVSVMVACRQQQHPPITRLGKELTPNDVMAERIHRYLGAVKLTLFKHVCDDDGLFQVDVEDDFLPQGIYDAQQIIERAYGTVTFKVQALINKRYNT